MFCVCDGKKKDPPKYFDENLLGRENNEDSTVLGSIQKKNCVKIFFKALDDLQ